MQKDHQKGHFQLFEKNLPGQHKDCLSNYDCDADIILS